MCLERAFSGYLAYFFKVGLRSDTKGPKRGKEGEGLSPVDIGDRASDPDGDEIQEALTQIVRAYFLADFLAPRPACCHCVCERERERERARERARAREREFIMKDRSLQFNTLACFQYKVIV